MSDAGSAHAAILAQTVFVRGENRPFGDVTVSDARERADELRSAAGWGPTARVAPVARAWRELALAMDAAGADVVRALDEAQVEQLAPKLWVVLPGR